MLVKSQVASVKNTHVLCCDVGDSSENECVSQQEIAEVKAELAAVKADMQGQMDTLQRQVNYGQNVTINILMDLYFSSNSGNAHAATNQCL